MPVPTNFPPYDNINWELGFGPNQLFGASGPTSIDPNTGELIADPSLLGKFVVGIVAKEYRNGVLIGSTSRDFLFTVFDCIVNVTAEIVPKKTCTLIIAYAMDSRSEERRVGKECR